MGGVLAEPAGAGGGRLDDNTRMATVDIEGTPFHVRIDGPESAPPLLLSNSLSSEMSMWDDQLPAWSREFRPDMTRVNVNGGAIALGHPLGASGTRLLSTLLCELERSGGRYGLQTMCEGGGMANATVIERL